MKIARFSTGDEPRYGIVQGLPEHETVSGESEGHLLVLKGDPLYSLPEATGEVVELREARLLSPVIPRSKVVGIGKNYAGHIVEMGEDEPPRDPVVFLKPNTSVIGPDAPIVLPAWSEEVHYEAELAGALGDVVGVAHEGDVGDAGGEDLGGGLQDAVVVGFGQDDAHIGFAGEIDQVVTELGWRQAFGFAFGQSGYVLQFVAGAEESQAGLFGNLCA